MHSFYQLMKSEEERKLYEATWRLEPLKKHAEEMKSNNEKKLVPLLKQMLSEKFDKCKF